MELKLAHGGFATSSVSNGEAALELLKKETFDVILLDLVMPKVDGFDVLQELKKRNLHTPVIVLSNLSQIEDEKKVRALGAREFFVKSNTPLTQIVERVQSLLK